MSHDCHGDHCKAGCGCSSCGGHSGSGKCGCHSCQSKCCHSHEVEGHEDFGRQLIEMADHAWMEVLKEKMKAHILAKDGQRLDELAKLVSDANQMRWKEKMSMKRGCHEFKEKLWAFFSSSK